MKRLFILTGLLLLTGALFNPTIAQNRENQVREQSIKYQRLMAYIDAFYVDTVNTAFSFKKYCSSLVIVVKMLIFVHSDAEAPP